jgi:hypothetical protein
MRTKETTRTRTEETTRTTITTTKEGNQEGNDGNGFIISGLVEELD